MKTSEKHGNMPVPGFNLQNYEDFCAALLASGFSMGGGNPQGIFAVVPFGWNEQEFIDSLVRWHTGDPDTDPWEWRMRVLEERDDIAYAKLFFRSGGFITKDWYPYFLAARRRGKSFAEAYQGGTFSQAAKRIYEAIDRHGRVAYPDIKLLGQFTKEDKSQFERAIVELQMGMFITICGREQKLNRYGEPYGWNSTVFCTTEDFFGNKMMHDAGKIPLQAAIDKITEQIYTLNPQADKKKISKFISG